MNEKTLTTNSRRIDCNSYNALLWQPIKSKYITSISVICSKQTAFQVSPLSAVLHFFYFAPMYLQAVKAMLEIPVTLLFVSIDELNFMCCRGKSQEYASLKALWMRICSYSWVCTLRDCIYQMAITIQSN
jgi:hypothetical protein